MRRTHGPTARDADEEAAEAVHARRPHRPIWVEFEPAFACLSYALCSVSLSLFNKMVFSGKDFNYPVAVLAFQSLCAVFFVKAGELIRLSEPVPFSKDMFAALAPVTVLFCAMLWSSGLALRRVSMPIFTVCKNLAVVGTTAWEFCRFGTRVSWGIVLSLGLMVSGSIVAGAGDLTASREGLAWMAVNVVMTVAYVASLKEFLSPDLPSAGKTLHNNALSLVLFAATALSTGELIPFCSALRDQTASFQLALVFTGVLGTAINLSTFWCSRVTSGATYAFVGASNKIPVAVIGHFAFESALTGAGWAGVTLGLGSGLVYAITKERERRLAQGQPGAPVPMTMMPSYVRIGAERAVDPLSAGDKDSDVDLEEGRGDRDDEA